MSARRGDTDTSDPIRNSESAETGDLGEAAAVKAFAKFGWPATLTTAAQDHGTDVLIQARDRRFNRGEYIGAQVKSGSSNLAARISDDDGNHLGWWVEVKVRHADYWIDNALPHLLILFDHTTDLCHWVHLTAKTITSTGKGRKVNVPVKQVIERDQIETLLTVAATARAAVALEGTAWTGSAPRAASDRLRFALVAPRLMAPHPNSGLGPADPAEGIALLMQARVDDVWPFGTPHRGVPSRQEASVHDTWGWRFVAAVADWLTNDGSPNFELLRSAAPSVHQRVAATIVIAHRDLAAGETRRAQELLQDEIDADDAAPVDFAWLHLQLARAHQELANLDEARSAATLSLAIGATQRHDVTATAIRGIAGTILFDASVFAKKTPDFGSTIRFNDTAVAWWRSQVAYRGTVALIDTAFDRAVGREPSDYDKATANNQLFAASIQAGMLGSHGQWRHLSGLLARQQIIDQQTGNADGVAETLGLLRRAGVEKAASRATHWSVFNGPADAVAAATHSIDLSRSTSSTVRADAAMLCAGADVVDEPTATAAADWLDQSLEDPTRLRALTYRIAYDPQQWIAEQLAGIYQAIPLEGAERTINAIERHSDEFGVLAERSWAAVLTAIPRWAWTADQIERLRSKAPSFIEAEMIAAVAYAGQTIDPTSRRALLDLVRAGKFWALDYIDDLTTIDPAILDELLSLCCARLDEDRAAEHDGTLGRGASRPLDALVAILLVHPAPDLWGVVQRVLRDSMPGWYKRRAIARLADGREQIDESLRGGVAAAVRAAAQCPPTARWGARDDDLTADASYANAVLDGSADDRRVEIVRLATGDFGDRYLAARLADIEGEVAALGILAADDTPLVRAAAAAGLARADSESQPDSWIREALTRVVGDRGKATGLAVAQVVADARDVTGLDEILAILGNHPSGEVRRLIQDGDR